MFCSGLFIKIKKFNHMILIQEKRIPFEMLEMKQLIETLDPKDVADGVTFVKTNWVFKKDCDDSVIENGVKYALAIVKKIKERGWEAITLIDVDGMKKLEGFPPAMVFMLLEHYTNILTIPENDVLGAVTQLIMKYLIGQTVPYLEYYEFFEKSMLIGVPDYVPENVTDGKVKVSPEAFGLLNQSLLDVSTIAIVVGSVLVGIIINLVKGRSQKKDEENKEGGEK